MTTKAYLLASALLITAAPAFAQSNHTEVGNLKFDNAVSAFDSSQKTTPLAVAKPATTAPAAAPTPAPAASPTLSFADQSSTVSRNASSQFGNTRDWTGFYVGGQIGYANVDTNVTSSNDDFIGGIFVGYDYDLGNVVVGGGLDYDFADINVDGTAVDVENVFRLRGRIGYKIGEGLLYGTGGYAVADTNALGSDDGYFIGAGYEHFVSNNFTVGGEVLYHNFNDFNSSGIDVEATTVQVRGTFRF